MDSYINHKYFTKWLSARLQNC